MSTRRTDERLHQPNAQILVVDDNPGDLDFLVELLEDYDVRTALDGKSALEAVEEEPPDLILLDITMPDMDGFEVCLQLKENENSASIPVIFLSARDDVHNIVKGFKLGGVDYITKPYLPEEVKARIHTHLKLCHVIQKLSELANSDELTGIPNRRNFFAHIEQILELAKREKRSLHLALIDIDNFKNINDTYGHAIGDKVMKHFTNTVQEVLPNSKIFARLGGDEFVLLLEDISTEDAHQALETLRKNIEHSFNLSQETAPYTVSIGLSTLRKEHPSIDKLLLVADINLYRAKQTKNALH